MDILFAVFSLLLLWLAFSRSMQMKGLVGNVLWGFNIGSVLGYGVFRTCPAWIEAFGYEFSPEFMNFTLTYLLLSYLVFGVTVYMSRKVWFRNGQGVL